MNTLILKSFVSRSKTLLKRRRRAVKGLNVSKKTLKQESKKYNIAKAYKELQIRKELDKNLHPQRHANELMEQIFYPDIRYENEKAVEMSIKMQQLPSQVYNQQFDELNPLDQQILKCNLATELLQLYKQKRTEFTLQNLTFLLNKFKKYFINRQKLKEKYERKWKKSMQVMKKKDFSFKPTKCPYLFLDKNDIHHYQLWNYFIDDLNEIIAMSPLQTLWVQTNYCLLIESAVGFLPSSLYDTILQKLFTLPQEQNLDQDQRILAIKLFNQKNFIKHSHTVQIKEPTQLQQTSNKIQKMGKFLCMEIISDTNCSYTDLITVMKTVKSGYNFLQQQILTKAMSIVMANLEKLTFQRTLDIFEIYISRQVIVEEFLQILKFDLFRKMSICQNRKYYFRLLKLSDRVKKHIPIEELLVKTFQTITSKYMGKQILQYDEIQMLVNSYFENNIRDSVLLQLLVNQFIRNSQKFTLEELTKMCFQSFILGYHSSIMSKFLFNQFSDKYNDRMERLSQNAKLLLPNDEEQEGVKFLKGKSPQQIHLQQSLMISLWMMLKTSKQNEKLPLQNILQLYPLTINSQHPLAIELSQNIFSYLENYKLFKKIKYNNYKIQLESDHKLNIYYNKRQPSQVQKILKIQAEESDKFILNYYPQKQIYLQEEWSENNYIQENKYAEWLIENQNSNVLYFNNNKQISKQLSEGREKLRTEYRTKIQNVKEGRNGERPIKYYDLL